jgi:hypothetical protein
MSSNFFGKNFMVKEIQLTQGKVTIVDDINFDFLNRFTWRYNNGYAVSQVRLPNSDRRVLVGMSNLIVGVLQKDIHVDHINGDKLNNTILNLRICTPEQNLKNRKPNRRKVNTDIIYKGVVQNGTHRKYGKRYYAVIRKDGKQITVGPFQCQKEAAKAYDEKALEIHGEFARTNKSLGLL